MRFIKLFVFLGLNSILSLGLFAQEATSEPQLDPMAALLADLCSEIGSEACTLESLGVTEQFLVALAPSDDDDDSDSSGDESVEYEAQTIDGEKVLVKKTTKNGKTRAEVVKGDDGKPMKVTSKNIVTDSSGKAIKGADGKAITLKGSNIVDAAGNAVSPTAPTVIIEAPVTVVTPVTEKPVEVADEAAVEIEVETAEPSGVEVVEAAAAPVPAPKPTIEVAKQVGNITVVIDEEKKGAIEVIVEKDGKVILDEETCPSPPCN